MNNPRSIFTIPDSLTNKTTDTTSGQPKVPHRRFTLPPALSGLDSHSFNTTAATPPLPPPPLPSSGTPTEFLPTRFQGPVALDALVVNAGRLASGRADTRGRSVSDPEASSDTASSARPPQTPVVCGFATQEMSLHSVVFSRHGIDHARKTS